jgi:hypothetical protein
MVTSPVNLVDSWMIKCYSLHYNMANLTVPDLQSLFQYNKIKVNKVYCLLRCHAMWSGTNLLDCMVSYPEDSNSHTHWHFTVNLSIWDSYVNINWRTDLFKFYQFIFPFYHSIVMYITHALTNLASMKVPWVHKRWHWKMILKQTWRRKQNT